MVAIVGGNALGLNLGSMAALGRRGVFGIVGGAGTVLRGVRGAGGAAGASTRAVSGRAARAVPKYTDTFFAAHPELEGKVWVHHSIEQQVLKRYPGLFSEAEVHALENLRGIPKSVVNDLHLSKIRVAWNEFYRTFGNGMPTRQQVIDYAKMLDKRFGASFSPPR